MWNLIKIYFYKDPKAYLILVIGLVSPLNLLLQSESGIAFNLQAISPLPVVFSRRGDLTKDRYSKYFFDFCKNEKICVTKKFSKDYYRNLSGPHRHKVFHFIALKRTIVLENQKNKLFYKNFFCKNPDIKSSFKIDFNIHKVIIRNNQAAIHEFKCTK